MNKSKRKFFYSHQDVSAEDTEVVNKLGKKSYNLLVNQNAYKEYDIELPKTMAISSDFYMELIERTGFKELIHSELKKLDVNNAASKEAFIQTLFDSFPSLETLQNECSDLHMQLIDF
mmetsp:Transcript_32580/g.70981  ORF Transcript_32580/g.70981 Transcript_32580/m.70981 type:complete len:118 (+) Transcript_32580:180-533(+)